MKDKQGNEVSVGSKVRWGTTGGCWQTGKVIAFVHLGTIHEHAIVENPNKGYSAGNGTRHAYVYPSQMIVQRSLYAYTFKPTGWNQTYALSLDEAKENVRKEWADSPGLLDSVDWNSFTLVLDEDSYYRATAAMCD